MERAGWGRWARAGAVALLAAVAFSPLMGTLADAGKDAFARLNEDSLAEHRRLATVSFLALSGLKAGLAVVENSGFTAGLDLEIGQVVQPLHDTVDIAWKVVMAAMVYYAAMGLFLQGLSVLFVLLLRAGLACLGAYLLLRLLPRPEAERAGVFFRSLGRHLLIASLVLYLFMPIFLWGGNLLSASLTGGAKAETTAYLEAQKDVIPEITRFYQSQGADPAAGLPGALSDPPEKRGWWASLWGKATGGISALTDLGAMKRWAEAKLNEIVANTILFIAAFLFDIVLVPALSLLGLVLLLRALLASFRREALERTD